MSNLANLRVSVSAVGDLIRQLIVDAMAALIAEDAPLAAAVLERLSVLDRQLADIASQLDILRAQDLDLQDQRLLSASQKIVQELIAIGHETTGLARPTASAVEIQLPLAALHTKTRRMYRHVENMLAVALQALAEMDAGLAFSIAKEDIKIDHEYRIFMRRCISTLMLDKDKIPHALMLLRSVRSLERIGNHARNIAEEVIYFVHADKLPDLGGEDGRTNVRGRGAAALLPPKDPVASGIPLSAASRTVPPARV